MACCSRLAQSTGLRRKLLGMGLPLQNSHHVRNIPGMAAVPDPSVGVDDTFAVDSRTGEPSDRKVGKLVPSGIGFLRMEDESEHRTLNSIIVKHVLMYFLADLEVESIHQKKSDGDSL